MTGADRCVRQRKFERLELVTEHIFGTLTKQVTGLSPVLYDPNLKPEEVEESHSWTAEAAKQRLHHFRRFAFR